MTETDPSFRVPPDKVSTSCMVYMARVTELRDFISFFFGIPRSRHNPKILWIDDAEIVGDRIT
jgi:hypothetical protein